MLGIAVFLLLLALAVTDLPGADVPGAFPVRESAALAATPVEDAESHDPLDGDPLDGPPRHADGDRNENLVELDIVRSGRPSDTPNSLNAYDGDPRTVWSLAPETEEAWLWFDLGDRQPLREVRWLARGGGAIDIAVSSDRDAWEEIGARPVRGGWQTVEVPGEARYVRLTVTADENGEPPAVAEVSAYGVDRGKSASLAQKAENKQRKSDRTRDDAERTRDRTRDEKPARDPVERGTRAESRPGISAEPGETRCRGKRAKCRAEAGEISVDEDGCDGSGSCTIDIVADGGTANCDASGGDENKAGRGRGKSDDNGGRCEAIANGGAVTIGDIDP